VLLEFFKPCFYSFGWAK